MYSSTDCLQTFDISRCRAPVIAIVVLLAQLFRHRLCNDWHDLSEVKVEDGTVLVHLVLGSGVQQWRVVERWKDRFGEERARGEGMLVRRVVPSDLG